MKYSLIKKLSLNFIILGLTVMFASGCATMEGAGEDVESAGEAIQDAADG